MNTILFVGIGFALGFVAGIAWMILVKKEDNL